MQIALSFRGMVSHGVAFHSRTLHCGSGLIQIKYYKCIHNFHRGGRKISDEEMAMLTDSG